MRTFLSISLSRKGAAALEFVLIVPVLAFILLAVTDYGNVIQQNIRIQAATRAGAQIALSNPAATADQIRGGIMDNLRGLGLDSPAACRGSLSATGDVCVNVRSWCQCATAAIDPANAVAACADDTTSTCPLARYVTLNVSRPYSPLILTPVTTLRANLEIRAQ